MRTITRRSFVAGGVAGFASLLTPSLLSAQSAAGRGRNVVFVNLVGGVDGLGAYPCTRGSVGELLNGSLRKSLGVPFDKVLPVVGRSGSADDVGFHESFKPLYDVAKEKMRIIRGYGIPGDPGRSHDTCQVLTSLGRSSTGTGASDPVGFLAKVMDQGGWSPYQYWVFSTPNPSDYNTTKRLPTVVSSLAEYDRGPVGWEGKWEEELSETLQRYLVEIRPAADRKTKEYNRNERSFLSTLATVRSDVMTQSVSELLTSGEDDAPAGKYGRAGVARALHDAAKVIKWRKSSGQKGDALFLVAQESYDTHSNQNVPWGDASLAYKLKVLASNLATFYKDLRQMGAADDTVVVLYSEFGRTVRENGTPGTTTIGTDHGHGSNTLVFGGPVTAGVTGDPPTTAELRDDYYNALRPRIDYRDVFSEVLAWVGADPARIFTEPGYTRRKLGIIA